MTTECPTAATTYPGANNMAYSKKPHHVTKIINGTAKTLTYTNEREARMYTAMSIVDNNYGTKQEANSFASSLKPGIPQTFKGNSYTLHK